jgi:hypothetical protein
VLLALVGEVGELAELFQWLSAAQAKMTASERRFPVSHTNEAKKTFERRRQTGARPTVQRMAASAQFDVPSRADR